jgi:L-2,4-diaminobutyrate decarboxylase
VKGPVPAAEVRGRVGRFVRLDPAPVPLSELRAEFAELVEPSLVDYADPGFQGMFNAAPDAAARWGATEVASWNQGVTAWEISPGGSELEAVTTRWVCRLFGLPEEADASFMYSGSYANHQALYLALARWAARSGFDLGRQGLVAAAQPPVLLVTGRAHLSIRASARLLGIGEDALLPVGGPETIGDTLRQAGIASRRVAAVVATAGGTDTGAVDPLSGLRAAADDLGTWLHVDAAYGGSYALLPELAPLFAGLTEADSVTWDPHKTLGVPIPNSVLMLRDAAGFGPMAVHSAYINHREGPGSSLGLRSLPTTKQLQALPLLARLRTAGRSGLLDQLRGPLRTAQEFAAWISQAPGWELHRQPDLGVVCFRRLGTDSRALYLAALADGGRTVSTTVVDGEAWLRVVAVDHSVQLPDLIATVGYLERLAGAAR